MDDPKFSIFTEKCDFFQENKLKMSSVLSRYVAIIGNRRFQFKRYKILNKK